MGAYCHCSCFACLSHFVCQPYRNFLFAIHLLLDDSFIRSSLHAFSYSWFIHSPICLSICSSIWTYNHPSTFPYTHPSVQSIKQLILCLVLTLLHYLFTAVDDSSELPMQDSLVNNGWWPAQYTSTLLQSHDSFAWGFGFSPWWAFPSQPLSWSAETPWW